MNGLVMCDYDGTIADSYEMFTSFFLAACRRCGADSIRSAEHLLNLMDGNFFEAMTELGLDDPTIAQILKTFQAEVNQHLGKVNLFSGMGEALTTISRQNTVIIITSNLSHVVRQMLARHDLDCVDAVLGAEKEKSKVRKIKQTMERFAQRPAFYIGDTLGDIIEGRKAGALTVAVTWGWHGVEKLKTASPDFVVSSREELTKLFV